MADHRNLFYFWCTFIIILLFYTSFSLRRETSVNLLTSNLQSVKIIFIYRWISCHTQETFHSTLNIIWGKYFSPQHSRPRSITSLLLFKSKLNLTQIPNFKRFGSFCYSTEESLRLTRCLEHVLMPWEIPSLLFPLLVHNQWLPSLPISVNWWRFSEAQIWISFIARALQVSCLHLSSGLLRTTRGWRNGGNSVKPLLFLVSAKIESAAFQVYHPCPTASAPFNHLPTPNRNPDDGELPSYRWKIFCLDSQNTKY